MSRHEPRSAIRDPRFESREPRASLAQSAAAGAKWSVVSVAGRRVVTVVTSVVLARLLSPADFGMMAMALVFIGLVELVRDMGTGAAIVQAEQPGEHLLSSIFWLNVGVGVIASALLVAVAPIAALLFREPRLTRVLQVLSLSPFLGALSVVPASLLMRDLRFRRLAIGEVGGAIAGGIVGIVLAVRGYAVWSLVWQSVFGAFAISAAICLTRRWRPRFVFRVSEIRSIAGFSANLTGFNLLTYVVRNADNFLIGRYLGAQSLGLYDLAFRVMLSSLQLVSAAFGRALFPVYTRIGIDRQRLGAAYLKVTAAIALIVFPMIFGLTGVADTFVAVLFGPAWAPAVPLLLILAPLGMLQALATSVINIYQTLGRTDLLFRWGIASGVLVVASFVVGLRWGVVGVAACYTIVSFGLAYLLFKIPLALIGLPVSALVRSISRPVACSLGMLVVVLIMKQVLPEALPPSAVLMILVPAAMLVYAAATWSFNRDTAVELLRLVMRT